MITKEQIGRHCTYCGLVYSRLLFATLDRDYQADDYIIPVGTIIELRLYALTTADLYVHGKYVTGQFPYDAATLLEE